MQMFMEINNLWDYDTTLQYAIPRFWNARILP